LGVEAAGKSQNQKIIVFYVKLLGWFFSTALLGIANQTLTKEGVISAYIFNSDIFVVTSQFDKFFSFSQ
jgi:hypothetical protein